MQSERLKIPFVEEAEAMMEEAARRNPGPWVLHVHHAARAAMWIAAEHPALDEETAYVMGLLHDVGRQDGKTDLRHIVSGYVFLHDQGYEDAARISLTHSFPLKDIRTAAQNWDGTPEELEFVTCYLDGLEYDDYDRLIQLCDSLTLPEGFCLIEKRLVDVALRRGINQWTIAKWQAVFDIQKQFEAVIGHSIYQCLPGVVEHTFGFSRA